MPTSTAPSDAYPVMCAGVHSLQEAQSVEKMRIDRRRRMRVSGKVIETGWTCKQ